MRIERLLVGAKRVGHSFPRHKQVSEVYQCPALSVQVPFLHEGLEGLPVEIDRLVQVTQCRVNAAESVQCPALPLAVSRESSAEDRKRIVEAIHTAVRSADPAEVVPFADAVTDLPVQFEGTLVGVERSLVLA